MYFAKAVTVEEFTRRHTGMMRKCICRSRAEGMRWGIGLWSYYIGIGDVQRGGA